MSLAIVFAGLLQVAAVPDSARLVGSTLVIEPLGLAISLPPEWFGARDTVSRMSCGHRIRGRAERRLAVSRENLDSVLHAAGEWDREYSAVTDSILPFTEILAHLGPEPFGKDSRCFADLQFRVYLSKSSSPVIASAAASRGLPTARTFFSSATIASRDSAEWHIQRLRWNAYYYDYGGEANVEIFSTDVGGATIVLVFMRASGRDDYSERDQRFILTHVKRP